MTNDRSRPLHGALIGCGFFARNHLHAWAQIDGVEIVALCDANAERLAEASALFGISKVYASAQTMLRQEKLDFVDIATTVGSHRALVEIAASNGIPCICQKPLSTTLSEGEEMVGACARANVPLMVHENFRWQTPIQAVKKILDSGQIGDPFWGRISFRSAFDVFTGQPYLATESRFILQDLGIHIIDIARFLFGEVDSLSSSTRRINPKIRGEDVATLLMKHIGGATSVVDCSYATALPHELFPQTLIEIDGTHGTLRLASNYELTLHCDGQTSHQTVAPPLHSWAQKPWHNIQDSVLNIQQHWLNCLQTGMTPQTSGEDNLKTLALVEAAYDSAADGQKTIHLQK